MTDDSVNGKLEGDVYFVALVTLACALPLSKFMMTLSELTLLFVWLFGSVFRGGNRTFGRVVTDIAHDVGRKCKLFVKNREAVVFASIYVMHIVGLLYTSDFEYALKDLRIKLPILLLPIIMSSMRPVSEKQIHTLLNFYIAAVFAGTLFSFAKYITHDFVDPRELSVFINPIRFALNITLAVLFVGYFVVYKRCKTIPIFVPLAMMGWFVFILVIMESLSGLACLVVAAALLIVFYVVKRPYRWVAVAASLVFFSVCGLYLNSTVRKMSHAEPVDFSELDSRTAHGNPYLHDTINYIIEDGRYTGLYICHKELAQAWKERSSVPYYGLTANGNGVQKTVVRYLASKDLRGDYDGLMQLSDEDIRYIEQGVANSRYVTSPGMKSRLMKTVTDVMVYKYDYGNYTGGGSLTQRLEFTRASVHIIKNNFLIGVGTGDIRQAFADAYDEIGSPLSDEFRHRAHNQYIAMFVAFGIIGLLWFLTALFFPFLSLGDNRNYLYAAFFFVMLCSMIPEDTIESQDGATMFAFFNAFLLFATKKSDDARLRR